MVAWSHAKSCKLRYVINKCSLHPAIDLDLMSYPVDEKAIITCRNNPEYRVNRPTMESETINTPDEWERSVLLALVVTMESRWPTKPMTSRVVPMICQSRFDIQCILSVSESISALVEYPNRQVVIELFAMAEEFIPHSASGIVSPTSLTGIYL